MNQSEGVGKPEIHLKLMVETHEKIVEGFLVAMRRHKYPSPAWHYCGIDKRMEKVKKKKPPSPRQNQDWIFGKLFEAIRGNLRAKWDGFKAVQELCHN